MPCERCEDGSWVCGTGQNLCDPSQNWEEVGKFCIKVYVRKHPDTGECQVKLVPQA